MARISRKELKHDRFVEEVGQSVLYMSSHRRQLLFGIAGIVLLVIGVVTWAGYREANKREASSALKKGTDMYHGKVDTEQVIGSIQFPTSIARFRDTRDHFDKIVQEYPGGEEEVCALYYLSLLDIEQNKFDDARARLEGLMNGRGGECMALIRLLLADLYAQESQYEEAVQQYKYLVDNPTRLVSRQRSQLAWAHLLIENDPEKAKALLEELQSAPGRVSGEAKALLLELEGS